MVFTPATIVEFGPAFTKSRNQWNGKKGFLDHLSIPVHPPGQLPPVLISYEVTLSGDA